MSTEQPAPETDAAAEPARYFKEESQDEPSELCMVVSINFARTLELQRDSERLARQTAEKERDACKAKLESRTRRMLARINDLGAQLSEKGATLRATRDADHVAAIELRTALIETIGALEMLSTFYRHREPWKTCGVSETIREAKEVAFATITNSQQKGGDETCALTYNPPANQIDCETASDESVKNTGQSQPSSTTSPTKSASNAAPTSDPEGAA